MDLFQLSFTNEVFDAKSHMMDYHHLLTGFFHGQAISRDFFVSLQKHAMCPDRLDEFQGNNCCKVFL